MEETFVKVVLFSDKGQEWKAPRVLNYEVNVEILGTANSQKIIPEIFIFQNFNSKLFFLKL